MLTKTTDKSRKIIAQTLDFAQRMLYLCHCNPDLDSLKLHLKGEAAASPFLFPRPTQKPQNRGTFSEKPTEFGTKRRFLSVEVLLGFDLSAMQLHPKCNAIGLELHCNSEQALVAINNS